MFKKTNPLQTPSPVWVSQCRQGEGCAGWGRRDCRPPTRRPRRSCTAGRGSESPATWLGQLGAAAWTRTLSPQAAQVLVRPLAQEDAVGAGAAARGRMGGSSTREVLQLLLNGSLADARWLQQAQHHFFTVSQSQKKGCCF
ncbi:PREDICTED: progressive rod-cone degeneration protein isoform X1 [Cercocebus atys]|uniref:progressive rod-cone degeneration protein isoform X1 n=1 Tax=Cercocebus atys TaxID=9531 RepID=UPI0005F53708|nr:PREDICTED: progressive rod-cone degeneration protein isoform X1 [Cercocebus atys]